MKSKPAKTAPSGVATAALPPPLAQGKPHAALRQLNQNLNNQSRRVLGQHYRAKYGVK